MSVMATKRRRNIVLAVIGAVVVVVLVAFLGPYVYIHFIEGPAPAKLQLPKSSTATTSSTSRGSSSASSSLDGTWNVGAGSMAGYRVQEVLIGQNATAVGRTSKIWGSMTIAVLDGDEGDVHRRHGQRRQRPESSETLTSTAPSWT